VVPSTASAFRWHCSRRYFSQAWTDKSQGREVIFRGRQERYEGRCNGVEAEMSFNATLADVKPALHSLRKAEMWTALANLGEDPEFFPSLMVRIGDGEFLSTLAGELKVTHGILRNWIRGDKSREEAYQQAEKDGKQARITRILRRMHDTATAKVEGEITHADQARAAELMLKQEMQEEVRKAPSSIANIQINFVEAQDGKPKDVSQLP